MAISPGLDHRYRERGLRRPDLDPELLVHAQQTLDGRQRIRLGGPGIDPVGNAGDHLRQRLEPPGLQGNTRKQQGNDQFTRL